MQKLEEKKKQKKGNVVKAPAFSAYDTGHQEIQQK